MDRGTGIYGAVLLRGVVRPPDVGKTSVEPTDARWQVGLTPAAMHIGSPLAASSAPVPIPGGCQIRS
jgi:hypothetical protein